MRILLLVQFLSISRFFFFFSSSFLLFLLTCVSCFRVFLEGGPSEGVVVHAPILERTAFQVLRANQNLWGRRVLLWKSFPDPHGCNAPSSFSRSMSNVAVLVLDGMINCFSLKISLRVDQWFV